MRTQQPKILIYSHDSFGLGHLRRCRTIAHSLVGTFDDLSVIILSGSPIIGSFDFRSRVDFVRVPGVIKLRNGEYSAHSLPLGIEEMLELRASIIEHTADVFDPQVFIVDKEPLGLRGEVRSTLERLGKRGTRLVLGLRDVMDDPDVLKEEWERKGAQEALDHLYDDVWVYGRQEIHDPLAGIGVSDRVHDKALFTGYLRREAPALTAQTPRSPFGEEPYILVTPGGGGDGVELVDWVLRAYEAHSRPLFPAIIVLGPFMGTDHQEDFVERSQHLRDVHVIRFTPTIENLMDDAIAIVGMGGYNTFCEILSFDKPTLLVPRIEPRREQAIRASKAEAAGLVSVLPIEHYPKVEPMVEQLARLPLQNRPSVARLDGLLGGLDVIGNRVSEFFAESEALPARAAAGQ
ncbi:glycosyltransferase family protein [Amorphus orientalis]|uniref:Glycosyltransferase n=1 Tax=Amorphus orientalis TaxID=649198 RepID=A0AAE3VRS3_9HYPH|nr:glycosyltransferase [Amorphus orientalis]MDQ0317000.1 putative glycosyltransferase [Amorphus orientalis]